jgi:murein L,D-transpeptidase YcbB/YkuD
MKNVRKTSAGCRNLLAGAIVFGLVTPGWAWTKQTSSNDKQEITKVQQALKSKGDDPGPIDGIIGNKTRSALKEFQSSNGLKATGTLDKETKDKLGVDK